MKERIELFWLKYAQMQRAVDSGDDKLASLVDRELDSLLDAIIEHKALNALEMQMQFQFAIDLIKKEADDLSCTIRHLAYLQALVERYILPRASTELPPPTGEDFGENVSFYSSAFPNGVLDLAALEAIKDRIAVISPDCRVLFTNSVNAARLHKAPADLIGQHIAELVGVHRFRLGMKDALEQCFAGEIVEYTYAAEIDDRTVVVHCRMTPCYSSERALVGAMLVMKEMADRRRSRAA
ncbi:PAS domain-containing protein [Rhizobiaceae bacterium n13]|uniref:PAS domain-containing protein n=1 Tax=Ferirhizobium litorale TaxID=2927786 RepID=A0AAE3U4L1_9HYPH|nr:PAS domain-containing protein [Fererhizobium litorale]MDI7863561.1 PAS domain-containing protein [Fererhizobium litorale]MDI7923518.1 PAS domain-containing protein [Fererhizobium litorale]